MRVLYLFLLLSFLGVAVFGFVAMDSKHGTGTLCLAEIMNPAGCPEEKNTFSLIAFHTGVFNSFSLAVLLAAFALFISLAILETLRKQEFSHFVYQTIEKSGSRYLAKLTHWLALSEKRDPSAIV